MSASFDKAVATSRGFVTAISQNMLIKGDGGVVSSPSIGAGSMFGDSGQERRNRERYGLFRGWVYSAIDARATEAAGQPVNVARRTNATPNPDERSAPGRVKLHHLKTMPQGMASKTVNSELEIIKDHPLVDALERPNGIQHRWQFVYSFFANLDLTGWSYVVADEDDDGRPVFFSLPTTWVRVDHSKGPFTGIRIVNPNDRAGASEAPLLGRESFAFAHLPNPADPLSAYAPAAAQMMAIRIDDHIQTSQEMFFRKGIFPSMIATVGKNPGPVGQQFRPRLSAGQREQIHSAIGKTMQGVENYGSLGIVDGLIEKFERLSATQNEMGWDKSEDKIKARILSAFRVHPYILGEHVSVGGHAQVSAIEKRFCSGVNTGLDLLSTLMTSFIGPRVSEDERTLIWWDKCEAIDSQLRQQGLLAMRANDDITQNELRAEFGFEPDDDSNQNFIGKNGAQIVQTLNLLGNGQISVNQARSVFVGMGIPDDLADNIAGDGFLREEETTEDAIEALELAASALKISPKAMAGRITEAVR